MSVTKIMSSEVVTVEMDDELSVVKEIFDNTHFHHLLVVHSEKLIGVLSDRDLLKALHPNIGSISETSKDAALLNKKVHQIMTRKPISLTADAKIYEAVELFNDNKISCIPVVDDENKPAGILTWRDIMQALVDNRAKQLKG